MATPDDISPTISGHLGTISVQDVMGFVADLPRGGALEVDSPDGELVLYFDGKGIVGGKVRRGGVDTAALLLRRGRLTTEDLDAVRGQLEHVDLHTALLDSGRVDPEVIVELVAEELSENLLRLFNWTPGDFRFYEGRIPPMDVRPVSIEIPALLFESARLHEDWNALPELYADGATIFELRGEPRPGDGLALDLGEWQVLFLVTNRRRLSRIWEESPLGSKFETSRTLFGLASARLIQPIGVIRESSDVKTPEQALETDPPPPVLLAPSDSEDVLLTTAVLPAMNIPHDHDPEVDTQPVSTRRAAAPPPTWGTAKAAGASRDRRLTRSQIQVDRTPCLVQIVADGQPAAFPISGEKIHLGRSADSDLVLADRHVSARHARILREGDHFEIEDTQSSNGIRVNGQKLSRSTLVGGEEIEIFPYRFRFEMSFEIRESSLPTKSSPQVR